MRTRRSRLPEVGRAAGLDFRHVNGASPEKHLVETMGSGGLFFDYDNDGWIDVFLVDGGSLADPAVARQARHRLFRNRGNGTFEDVTAPVGHRARGYGMGACAGDYDNDGCVDLYITSFGANTLYRNRGTATFADVTRAARRRARRSGARAARSPISTATATSICSSPTTWTPTPHTTSSAATRGGACASTAIRSTTSRCRACSIATTATARSPTSARSRASARYRGNGLGVVVADYDDDGWPDVFVANDSVPNFLFHNARARAVQRGGRCAAGVAVASDGKRAPAWAPTSATTTATAGWIWS